MFIFYLNMNSLTPKQQKLDVILDAVNTTFLTKMENLCFGDLKRTVSDMSQRVLCENADVTRMHIPNSIYQHAQVYPKQ